MSTAHLPPCEGARAAGRQAALEHMGKSCPGHTVKWCLNNHSTSEAQDHHTKFCQCFLGKRARGEKEEP